MRRTIVTFPRAVCVAAALTSVLGCAPAAAPEHRAVPEAPAIRRVAMARPLDFEPNQGQTDPQVRYLAHAVGYDLFLTDREVVLDAPDNTSGARGSGASPLHIALVGASDRVTIEPALPMPGRVNYLLGRDPAKWRTGIPTYGRVIEHDAWDGIDVAWYGNQSRIECDFVVAPGADPGAIALEMDAPSVAVAADGSLAIAAGDARLTMQPPVVYQQVGGSRRAIEGRYRTAAGPDGRQRITFEVAAYDRGAALVIDPVLTLAYSTYLGDSVASLIDLSNDIGAAYPVSIAVDKHGNAYVAGSTSDVSFPTKNPYQPTVHETNSANGDAFVTKFSVDGGALVYSTYLGGIYREDPRGIAVDDDGSAYVVGVTGSSDFPTTPGAYEAASAHGGIFLTKFTPQGDALAYSTYLGDGQSVGAYGVAVDSTGHAYVVGSTNSFTFPTVNAYQASKASAGASDRTGFVTKFSADGQSLVYSTYLGGSTRDTVKAVAVDSSDQVYVTGSTVSTDFPTVAPFQDHLGSAGGYTDAFVTKFAADGRSLVYSTYLGGGGDELGLGIAVDGTGAAYVTGATEGGLPLQDPVQPDPGGQFDAFLTKLVPDGHSLEYSTFFGAGGYDVGLGIAVDAFGQATIAGVTTGIHTVNGLTLPSAGYSAEYGFVAQYAADGHSLRYATMLGGSTLIPGDDNGFNEITGLALDPSGNAYVAGVTRTIDFPLVNPFQTTPPQGVGAAFVSKLVFSEIGGTTTSTTIHAGATTTTTVGGRATTTSTTRPCVTALCLLESTLTSGACANQTIPAVVNKKITAAGNLLDRAAAAPAKKARTLRRKARRDVTQAGAKALHASRGRKATLKPDCADAISAAASRLANEIRAAASPR